MFLETADRSKVHRHPRLRLVNVIPGIVDTIKPDDRVDHAKSHKPVPECHTLLEAASSNNPMPPTPAHAVRPQRHEDEPSSVTMGKRTMVASASAENEPVPFHPWKKTWSPSVSYDQSCSAPSAPVVASRTKAVGDGGRHAGGNGLCMKEGARGRARSQRPTLSSSAPAHDVLCGKVVFPSWGRGVRGQGGRSLYSVFY